MTNAILLDTKDNVATCTNSARQGDTIKILGGGEIICVEDIPIWHKVALRTIGKGDKIFRAAVVHDSEVAPTRVACARVPARL